MNISNLKSRFPVFKKNPNLVFLDTAAAVSKKTRLGFFLNTGNLDFKFEIFISLYLSILLVSFVLFQTFVHYQYYLILH